MKHFLLTLLLFLAVPGYLISSVALERLRLRGRIPTELMQRVQLIHEPERWLEARSPAWTEFAKRECFLIDDLIFGADADYCEKTRRRCPVQQK